MEALKRMGDSLRQNLSPGVAVLGSIQNEKAQLVCVVSDDLIKDKGLKANEIIGEVAKIVGGGGGGRAHLATAGGKEITKLNEALQKVTGIVEEMLEKKINSDKTD